MKNRRGFLSALGAVSSAGMSIAMAAKARAQTPVPASPAAKQPRAPSAAALAIAATYRAFDPHLTAAETTEIARAIDANRVSGAELSKGRKPLRNSDEPVTRFAAAERIGG